MSANQKFKEMFMAGAFDDGNNCGSEARRAELVRVACDFFQIIINAGQCTSLPGRYSGSEILRDAWDLAIGHTLQHKPKPVVVQDDEAEQMLVDRIIALRRRGRTIEDIGLTVGINHIKTSAIIRQFEAEHGALNVTVMRRGYSPQFA